MKTILSTPEPRFGGKPLKVVRHGAARVMRLRVDPRDGEVRLTLPKRASLRSAYRWVEEQRTWVESQLSACSAGTPFVPGLTIEVAGASLLLSHDPESRSVRREADVLRVGGPIEMFEARVLRWLKSEALRVLDLETRELTQRHDVMIARVSVSDTRSRWGSCSAAGDIRYSWRLILAPEFVRRATVAHEVAHRVHMNHGPEFKALERHLLGVSPAPARAWLRVHGASLHRYGRS